VFLTLAARRVDIYGMCSLTLDAAPHA